MKNNDNMPVGETMFILSVFQHDNSHQKLLICVFCVLQLCCLDWTGQICL